MPISIPPFYDSDGPQAQVGKYSKELESSDPTKLLQLSSQFEKEKDTLGAEQMYVLAVRLYDTGQKDQAVYWFYTAQYRGRLFRSILDQQKVGGIGSAEFELPAAFASFNALAGHYINEYAMGDLPKLEQTLAKVKAENTSLPRMADVYPNIHFIPDGKWAEKNKEISQGLADFIDYIKANENTIKAERRKNGVESTGTSAAVDGNDPDHFTPLMQAAQSNPSVQAIADLIKAGADVNAQTRTFDVTPLMFAAHSNKNPMVAAFLIKAGAKVNFKNRLGETPLGEAAGWNTAEVVAALIKAGADVNARGAAFNETPLMAAASMNPEHDVVFVLLKAGAAVNTHNDMGWTPLMSEVEIHDVDMEIISALLKAGADVNARDKDGRTPLIHWSMGGNLKPEVVTALVKAGADTNARDNDGQTALIQYTRFNSNPHIITALVAAGADVNIKDKEGKTALDYARQKESGPSLVPALERAGAK